MRIQRARRARLYFGRYAYLCPLDDMRVPLQTEPRWHSGHQAYCVWPDIIASVLAADLMLALHGITSPSSSLCAAQWMSYPKCCLLADESSPPSQVYYPAHATSRQLRRSYSFQRLEHATSEVTRGSPLLARSSWVLEPEQARAQPLLFAENCLRHHVFVCSLRMQPTAQTGGGGRARRCGVLLTGCTACRSTRIGQAHHASGTPSSPGCRSRSSVLARWRRWLVT